MEENTRRCKHWCTHAAYGHNGLFKGNYMFRMSTAAWFIIDYLAYARQNIDIRGAQASVLEDAPCALKHPEPGAIQGDNGAFVGLRSPCALLADWCAQQHASDLIHGHIVMLKGQVFCGITGAARGSGAHGHLYTSAEAAGGTRSIRRAMRRHMGHPFIPMSRRLKRR